MLSTHSIRRSIASIATMASVLVTSALATETSKCLNYRCPQGYKLNRAAEASGEDSDAKCCLETCAPYACPAGYQLKVDADSILVVDDKHCCQPTCESYRCKAGFMLNPLTTLSTDVTAANCCKRETCAFHRCPPSFGPNVAKANSQNVGDSNCCVPLKPARTCAIFNCTGDLNVKNVARYNSTILTLSNCCLPGIDVTDMFNGQSIADLSNISPDLAKVKCCCHKDSGICELKKADRSYGIKEAFRALLQQHVNPNGCGALKGSSWHSYMKSNRHCFIREQVDGQSDPLHKAVIEWNNRSATSKLPRKKHNEL